MEPALHLANLVLLLSYAALDILWLRLLTVVGLLLLVGVDLASASTLGPVALWNLAFVAVNGLHAAWLIWERRPVRLTDEEQALRHVVFTALTDRQVVQLFRLGEWINLPRGHRLLRQDRPVDTVSVIASGRAVVERGGRRLHGLGPGEFVGELSYLTGEAASADVRVDAESRCLRWSASRLRTALEADPELRAVVQGCLGMDVATKLTAMNTH